MLCGYLNRFAAGFTGSDADAVVHGKDKNLSVADSTFFTASPAGDDRIDRGLNELLIDRDLQLHFAKQVDARVVAKVRAGLALLSTEPLAFQHRQANDLDLAQRCFNGLELAWLNDSDDEFHGCLLKACGEL